ncbi:hypothetical protein ABAC460_07165 [Asticcacaulis sp. AC460]|nr:hypothetical protein ABAC460_07165 [Asticcacaulis sp. AC460]
MTILCQNQGGFLVSTHVEILGLRTIDCATERYFQQAVTRALEHNLDGRTELATAGFEAIAVEMREAGAMAVVVNSVAEEPTPGACLASILDAMRLSTALNTQQ